MQKKPFNLILLGDPASGKGTQATRLIKRYHLYNFDMGREVRRPIVRAKYDYTRTTAIGNLTPTGVVRSILRRVIHTVPLEQGILFNGHPKMIGEAKLVARLLKQYKRSDPLVLYLSIPTGETIRRVRRRREYMLGKFIRRDDDAEKALKNRRRYYKRHIARVVDFFRKRYIFKRVSGMGTRSEVWARTIAAIHQYESQNA